MNAVKMYPHNILHIVAQLTFEDIHRFVNTLQLINYPVLQNPTMTRMFKDTFFYDDMHSLRTGIFFQS